MKEETLHWLAVEIVEAIKDLDVAEQLNGVGSSEAARTRGYLQALQDVEKFVQEQTS